MVDFNYDSEVDILTVDEEGREPEDYEESLPVGDYVIDLDQNDRVLGVEILNASQNLPFTKQELESIQSAELRVEERSGARTITIEVEYQDQKGAFIVGYSPGVEA